MLSDVWMLALKFGYRSVNGFDHGLIDGLCCGRKFLDSSTLDCLKSRGFGILCCFSVLGSSVMS